VLLLLTLAYVSSSSGAEAPRIIQKDGRYALLVGDKPFLVPGALGVAARSIAADDLNAWMSREPSRKPLG